jgi:hypothetical protein
MYQIPIVVVPNEQIYAAPRRRRYGGILLAVVLLCAMAAAEVLFLTFVAGPDSVNMISAAEGIISSATNHAGSGTDK